MNQDSLFTDQQLSVILKKIQQFNEGESTCTDITLEELDAKGRSYLYNTIETQYTEWLACEKKSFFDGKQKQVTLILTKKKCKRRTRDR